MLTQKHISHFVLKHYNNFVTLYRTYYSKYAVWMETKKMPKLLRVNQNLSDQKENDRKSPLQVKCNWSKPVDFSFSDAGLGLLSLYIHELWSGATSSDLFLSHVSLVTKAKHKKQKGSKSSAPQPSIRAICNDIIAMKS